MRSILMGSFLAIFLFSQSARAEPFRVGPLYEDGDGRVSVVVELPYGVTPTKKDFLLRMDGEVVSANDLKTFFASNHGLSLLLCIDVSGTMAGGPLKDIKEALPLLLSDFRSGVDRVALITFGTDINILSDFENDYGDFIQSISVLKDQGPKSKTMLYQALFKSLNYYEELAREETFSLPKRQRILVISDGKDEGSIADADSVNNKSKTLGIPIDTIGRGKIQKEYIESLRALATATGGRFIHAEPDRLSLKNAFSQLNEELMKTRTVVAYFEYPVGAKERFTDNVVIELRQSGAPPLIGTIAANIPLPLRVESSPVRKGPEPQPSPNKFTWFFSPIFWIIGVLVMALAVLLIAMKKGQGKPPVESELPVSVPEPVTAPISKEAAKPERRTEVSCYFPPPAPGQSVAKLVGISGPLQGKQFVVEKEVFCLGANSENDLIIADDDYVSGNHACLRYEQGQLILLDQHSRNGTFLNDHRVTDTMLLNTGDRIRVGRSTFEVQI